MSRYCHHCTALEGEKTFKRRLRGICDSCARMRVRDRCLRCNGPRLKGRCGKCDPPPKGRIRVILLDKSSDHERIVYRALDHRRIYVAGKVIRVPEGETDIVFSLSRKEFLRTLC